MYDEKYLQSILEIITVSHPSLGAQFKKIATNGVRDDVFRRRIIGEVLKPAARIFETQHPDNRLRPQIHLTTVIQKLMRRLSLVTKDMPKRDIKRAPEERYWIDPTSDIRPQLKTSQKLFNEMYLQKPKHDDIVDCIKLNRILLTLEVDRLDLSHHEHWKQYLRATKHDDILDASKFIPLNHKTGDMINEILTEAEDELLTLFEADPDIREKAVNAIVLQDTRSGQMSQIADLAMSLKDNLSDSARLKAIRANVLLDRATRIFGITDHTSADVSKTPKPTQETNPMKFETIQYINGKDVNSLSKEALISLIGDSEKEVEKLEAITTESEAIKKEIDRIKTFIAQVVKVLDAKKD